MTETKWSSGAVLDRLCATTFSTPAHSVLREVRNSTGFNRATRSADALVVSLWPSRGVWFAGVEVKVSRSDWMAELKQPEKSAEIQQYCDYWWIVTPAGIVQPGELPETWGHIEVGVKKNVVVKQAPKLEAAALRAGFVAAVLRNRADREAGLIQGAVDKALLEAKQNAVVGPTSDDLNLKIARLEHENAYLKRDLDNLTKLVSDFSQASGVNVRTAWNGGHLGVEFALAKMIATHKDQLSSVAAALDATANACRNAVAVVKQSPDVRQVPLFQEVANAE